MEWVVAAAIAIVVVASFAWLAWTTSRRKWNVDGEDDSRRPR